MADVKWTRLPGEFVFETDLIRGKVIADGHRFAVAELTWKQGHIQVDKGMAHAPYRLLSRSGWMGSVREKEHSVELTDAGLNLTFAPTVAHQATLAISLNIVEADSIDCTADVISYATYLDYELLVSGYFVDGFRPGGYIGPGVRGNWVDPTQVRPVQADVYQDMYVAFPRDERAANLLTDGRWQRGRHFTRFAPLRYYGMPLGFFGHTESPLYILLMGRSEDVYSVSMAYHSDDPNDDVGQHRSLYMALFGRDLHPGQRLQTSWRVQLGEFDSQMEQHKKQHQRFLDAYPAPPHLDLDSP